MDTAVSAQMTVDTSPLMVVFMWAISALVFLNGWPALTKRPPLHHLKGDERWRHTRWWHLPSMRTVETLQWLANAFMAVAAVYYLYVTRAPVGTHDSNYYFSIEILFFVLCFTKCFWQFFLFAHYRHNAGVAFGIIAACVNTVLCVVLIVVLGLNAAWLPFGFMFPVLLYYLLTVGWSGHIAQHHWVEDC
jgi:hypothetical protein